MEDPTNKKDRTDKIFIRTGVGYILFFIIMVIFSSGKSQTSSNQQPQPAQAQPVITVLPVPETNNSAEAMTVAAQQLPPDKVDSSAENPLIKAMAVENSNSGIMGNLPGTADKKTFFSSASHICPMKDWGVEFTCDQDWDVSPETAGELNPLVVSQDPLLTLSGEKFDRNIRYLMQLNRLFFENTGHYKNGFVTENADFAGYKAILVKGYDAQLPDIQRRDYFYLYNDKLLSVSFKISDNKDQEGKMILQEVKNSFRALP